MTDPKHPIVQLEHVSKRFGSVLAVADLHMTIDAGQFVTFLGPSGCGKSTTLRMLGGFETPDQGRIILGGEDVTSKPPNRRDVNMVFQDYALFPHMSVAQNVAFGLELKGRNRAEIDRRLTELFEFLQLEGFSERRPDQLSGGQRQRVALARALAPDPKLLLLDEPLGALDAKLRGQVQVELKSIQQRTGKTFVFVTHDQEEALTMSDRIVVMNQGQVMQDGTPEELYHYPANRFVADFIGDTNLISCTVRGEQRIDERDEIILDWNGTQLRAQAHNDYRPQPGQIVEIALRPENVLCSTERPSLPNALPGKIVQRLFKGSRTAVSIAIGEGQDTLLQAVLDPFLGQQLQNDQVGDSLWVGWLPERMSILRDSG
ncbi:MAG: ABC transporter ATP-binding protein [Candidatus Competibacteraceae bacterium]|nr:ABC transporter ATP-binding protein [Candidatus Competibacteraceae bacterium]